MPFGFPGLSGGLGPPITTPPFGGGSIPGLGGGGTNSLGNIFSNPSNLLLLGTSILGSILNRPRSAMSDAQRQALNQLMATLSSQANAPVGINPQQRNLLFGNIAAEGVGAGNRVTNSLVSRGLGESGLLGSELGKVARTQQLAQSSADQALLQQSIEQRDRARQQLSGLIGLPTQPGQSVLGGAFSGFGPMLAYLMTLNQLGRNQNNQSMMNFLPWFAGMGGLTTPGA